MKKLEDIETFAIDCRSFCKGDIQMIVDKMLSVGIEKYDALDEYDWDWHRFWGYKEGYGTYTGTYTSGFAWAEGATLITLDQLDAHLGLAPEAFDLRNTKIDLRKKDGTVDEELSRAFQEAVFELEGRWDYGGVCDNVDAVGSRFLYVDSFLRITYTSGNDEAYFKKHKNKQISFSYERKLEWKAEYIKDKEPKQVVELPNGDKYFAEDLQEALSKIKKIEE